MGQRTSILNCLRPLSSFQIFSFSICCLMSFPLRQAISAFHYDCDDCIGSRASSALTSALNLKMLQIVNWLIEAAICCVPRPQLALSCTCGCSCQHIGKLHYIGGNCRGWPLLLLLFENLTKSINS